MYHSDEELESEIEQETEASLSIADIVKRHSRKMGIVINHPAESTDENFDADELPTIVNLIELILKSTNDEAEQEKALRNF